MRKAKMGVERKSQALGAWNERDVLGARLYKRFHDGPDFMVLLDRDSRILAANPAAIQHLSVSLDTIRRYYVINFLAPTQRPILIETLGQAIAGMFCQLILEFDNPIHLGEWLDCDVSFSHVCGRDGTALVLMTVLRATGETIKRELSARGAGKKSLTLDEPPHQAEASAEAHDLAEEAVVHHNRSHHLIGDLNLILEKRAAQQTTLNQIGQEIASTLELDKAVQTAADLLYANFGYFSIAIYLLDPITGEAVLSAHSGAQTQTSFHPARLRPGEGVAGMGMLNRRTNLTKDFNTQPSARNHPAESPVRSELAVPILEKGRLAGLLDVQSPLPSAFQPDDIEVIETVASQLAITAANAALYTRLQERLSENQRIEDLLRIQRDLLAAVGETNNFQDALTEILSILSPLHIFDCGSIYILNPEGGLKAVAHCGLTPDFAQINSYLPPEAHKTRFILLGKPGDLRYCDLVLDPRIPDRVRNTEAILSLVVLPILHKGKVIADLTLGSHSCQEIPELVHPIVEAVAEYLGTLISRLNLERARHTGMALDDRGNPLPS